ncbi:DUF2778 domain-containing protein [Enterobacteriaceae bacterium ESL0689]|nr:DUF2778 domain-containing protein [Enterobacteriaceae bacterium ESL0689]
MIRCTFRLNGQNMSTFSCPGVGFFPAYSGYAGSTRNNPNAIAIPGSGPLPTGRYYIVTRPTGGILSPIRDATSSILSGSNRFTWFALYKDDGKIEDHTFIGNVERGNFRLHPAGYRGISEGCITFPNRSDFEILRHALLQTSTFYVSSSLVAFGTVQVY